MADLNHITPTLSAQIKRLCVEARAAKAKLVDPAHSASAANGLREAMQEKTGVLDRAYQIARSGACVGANAVRRALVKEGFASVDLMDITPMRARELGLLCRKAQRVGISRSC